jgi:four helix bundle protein
MKTDNVVQLKSYAFALKIVKIYRQLVEEKHEYNLSKQLLRAGTSIAANVEESIGGQSSRDFLSKLSIAYKEARETKLWIRLLRDSELLENDEALALLNDIEELLKIIGSIQKTMKSRMSAN